MHVRTYIIYERTRSRLKCHICRGNDECTSVEAEIVLKRSLDKDIGSDGLLYRFSASFAIAVLHFQMVVVLLCVFQYDIIIKMLFNILLI